jgi:hypothetical protein
VGVGDGFWAARRKATTERSLSKLLDLLEEHSVFDNFRRLSCRKNVPGRGPVYTDSDGYNGSRRPLGRSPRTKRRTRTRQDSGRKCRVSFPIPLPPRNRAATSILVERDVELPANDLTAEARYADVLERTVYNGVNAGWAQSADVRVNGHSTDISSATRPASYISVLRNWALATSSC